jgi:CRP-like cAMP-binding protein
MLQHIAERAGRVTSDGTLIPIRLTHEALGKLVGARRPTVSLAMKELDAAGRVRRLADGTWLLPAEQAATSG